METVAGNRLESDTVEYLRVRKRGISDGNPEYFMTDELEFNKCLFSQNTKTFTEFR